MTSSIGGANIIFGDPRQPKCLPLDHPKARWDTFGTKTEVLPKGYQKRRGCLRLPCDILFERDTPIKLRDGTMVYVDIYRPTDETVPVPALLAWSPYGKQGGRGNQVLDDFPFRMGVPLHKLSELQKWEAPDPGYWVNHGYAVINADSRGAGKSEGNIYQFGSQEGRDAADVVDWIGERSWCNGKVAPSGNSYLSISQWFLAAEKPKHLAAIAPWEGLTDLYGEGMVLGGVMSRPGMNFALQLLQVNAGENSWENTVAMAQQHQIFGAYHADKRAKVEEIEVPAYVVASWVNPIHTYGTFGGYQRLNSDKWLRVHDAWEWPDYYADENVEDLRRFFDFYLKGIKNDWPSTPHFRARIIDLAKPLACTGRDFLSSDFPPSEMTPFRLFFDTANHSLNMLAPKKTQAVFKASDGMLCFNHTFRQDMIFCGPIKISLGVSLAGSNDADIFIYLEKVLVNGSIGQQLTVPFPRAYQSFLIRLAHWLRLTKDADAIFYRGPQGRIRVSRRVFATTNQVAELPTCRMDLYQPVQEDEVIQVQPIVAPIGMSFTAGEKLRVRISGKEEVMFPPVDQATLTVDNWKDINDNVSITLHSGLEGTFSSFIELPLVQQ